MQYKIPVQIENEDTIALGLSLRQLVIIVIWFWLAYWIFKNLETKLWAEIALIPTIFIVIVTLVIALFKSSEMTFVPFFLSFIRLKLNSPERVWKSWVDSYSPMDIWYVEENLKTEEEIIDLEKKLEKMKNLEKKLEKI